MGYRAVQYFVNQRCEITYVFMCAEWHYCRVGKQSHVMTHLLCPYSHQRPSSTSDMDKVGRLPTCRVETAIEWPALICCEVCVGVKIELCVPHHPRSLSSVCRGPRSIHHLFRLLLLLGLLLIDRNAPSISNMYLQMYFVVSFLGTVSTDGQRLRAIERYVVTPEDSPTYRSPPMRR